MLGLNIDLSDLAFVAIDQFKHGCISNQLPQMTEFIVQRSDRSGRYDGVVRRHVFHIYKESGKWRVKYHTINPGLLHR